MRRQSGLSLIELFLVISVIAIAVTFSIKQFRHYKADLQVAAIKSDVKTIRIALNHYYQSCGCKSDGSFNTDQCSFYPDIHTDLALKLSYKSRPPIVNEYGTSIIRVGVDAKNNKPIYELTILANLNQYFSEHQLNWYQKRLYAGHRVNHKLIWTALPFAKITTLHDDQWVLNGSREYFRHKNSKQNLTSDSNCA